MQASNNPPSTSNENLLHSYHNMPPHNSHSTQHVFNLNQLNATTSSNYTTNAPSYLLANLNYNPRLTQGQLQARHSLPKDLPTFSGQPEEWPLFSSTFEWSTKICGFTDGENLTWLQKSLSGDGLQKVQHILIL